MGLAVASCRFWWVAGIRVVSVLVAFRVADFGCCHEVSPSRVGDAGSGDAADSLGYPKPEAGLKRMRSVVAQALKERSTLAV